MTWQQLPGWSSDIVDGEGAFYPWLAKQLPPNAVHVEVGGFFFRSAACLATLRPDIKVLVVDPWETDYKHIVHGVDLVSLGGLPEDADILGRMPFYDAAIHLLEKHCPELFMQQRFLIARDTYDKVTHIPADSIFIDADHTYESGIADLTRAASMLKPGGLICGHDYEYQTDDKADPRFNPNPLFPGLVKAIDKYAAAHGKNVIVGTGNKLEWSTCWRLEDK
jgi:hypothetical protein